jgi:hypothetical protein
LIPIGWNIIPRFFFFFNGLPPSPTSLRRRARQLPHGYGGVTGAGFDLAIVSQTLEHLRNPLTALTALAASLKPNTGCLFVSAPALSIPHLTPFHFRSYTPVGKEFRTRFNTPFVSRSHGVLQDEESCS